MRPRAHPLDSKRLYLADLAQRLEAMERLNAQVNPAAYRLYARRMHTAMAGYPEALLTAQLGTRHPSVLEALDQRHFETHGVLRGPGAASALLVCARLLQRLVDARP
jgi:hypothetical protein